MLGEMKAARPHLVRTAAVIAAILFCYQATISWLAMPMLSDLFESAKRIGTTLTALRAATPGTLFVHAGRFDHNAVVYVHMPIRAVSMREMAQAPAGWALVSAADLDKLRELRGGGIAVRAAFGRSDSVMRHDSPTYAVELMPAAARESGSDDRP